MKVHTNVTRAILVIVIIFAILAPYGFIEYVTSLLTLAVITALLATSVNMLAGQVGLVSMGHAGIAAAAAYGIAWGGKQGYGVPGQLALALVLTLVVSVVYAATTMRTNGLVFLMITLALGVMVYGLALKWSAVTGGQSGLTGIHRPEAFSESRAFYYLSVVLFAATLVGLKLFAKSPLGLMLRGVRDSETRMASLGYSIAPAKFVAVMVSGLVAGLAGVLAVWQSEFISPSVAGFDRSAMAVVIVILGGIGATYGPLLGAALVVGIEYWLSSYVERWPTLLGALFIAVVILMPGGLAGLLQAGRSPGPLNRVSGLGSLLPMTPKGRMSERTAPNQDQSHPLPSPHDQKGQEVDQA